MRRCAGARAASSAQDLLRRDASASAPDIVAGSTAATPSAPKDEVGIEWPRNPSIAG